MDLFKKLKDAGKKIFGLFKDKKPAVDGAKEGVKEAIKLPGRARIAAPKGFDIAPDKGEFGFDRMTGETRSTSVETPNTILPGRTRRASVSPEERVIELQRDRDAIANQSIVNTNPGWKGRLADIAREALIGAAQGDNPGEMLGGAVAGAIGGGLVPTTNEKREQRKQLAETDDKLERAKSVAAWLENQNRSKVSRENIQFDNELQQQRLIDTRDARTERGQQAERNRVSKEQTDKMRILAGQMKAQPSIDFNNPAHKSLIDAALAAGLPVTARDAKVNMKPVQDAETGAWSVIITDPNDATKTYAVPVTLDGTGKQFVATSAAKVQAGSAMARQNDQQAFTAQQNEIGRQMQVAMENLRAANAAVLAATNNEAKIAAQTQAENHRMALLKLRQQFDALK
jgi:hypothetical protein